MNHASKSWRTVGKYLRVTVIVAECIAVAAVSAGAAGIGRIYRAPLMLPQATITDTTLYDFPAMGSNGIAPYDLVMDGSGDLFGVTYFGGLYGYGTVFELAKNGSSYAFGTLHNFKQAEGADPVGRLTLDSSGNLYGSTTVGGAYNAGAVFRLTKGSWAEQTLYSFTTKRTDGLNPNGGLVFDSSGNLYGTTLAGGVKGANCTQEVGCGIVFELSPPAGVSKPWTETLLHEFTGTTTDGGYPSSGLIIDTQHVLVGTTSIGGSADRGTVFAVLAPATKTGSWTEQTYYSFSGAKGDGAKPASSLLADAQGDLYGTTSQGGAGAAPGDGTVFELTPPTKTKTTWTESVLHEFGGYAVGDGYDPLAALTRDSSGNVFGTTSQGGKNVCSGFSGCGTVFELKPPATGKTIWTETILHDFTNSGGDGNYPQAAAIEDTSGHLFGTTIQGGLDAGTVFRITY